MKLLGHIIRMEYLEILTRTGYIEGKKGEAVDHLPVQLVGTNSRMTVGGMANVTKSY